MYFTSEKEGFNLREYMSTSEWIDVLSFATSAATDNEKVSHLGNHQLLYLILFLVTIQCS